MEVIYKKKFLKDIQNLPPKVQLAVKNVLDRLKKATDLESSGLDFTRIAGQKGGQNYFRIRVGSYRIGFEYVRPDVVVITVAARGDIYKHFPPK
jgi:mRNA interferase RelE/StbE